MHDPAAQITAAEVKAMSPDAINEAYREGRLGDVMSGRPDPEIEATRAEAVEAAKRERLRAVVADLDDGDLRILEGALDQRRLALGESRRTAGP